MCDITVVGGDVPGAPFYDGNVEMRYLALAGEHEVRPYTDYQSTIDKLSGRPLAVCGNF